MQSLPRIYSFVKRISLWKIPYPVGAAIVVVVLFSSLTSLALPAKASLEAPTLEKKLNEELTFAFPLPLNRSNVEIDISPKVEFDYEWSGILVNQTLKIKPTQLLQPNRSYNIIVKNVKNPLGTSQSNLYFSFKTESLPKVVNSDPTPESGRVKPNPVFSFTLDKSVDYGSYELVSSPYIETKPSKENGRTLEFSPNKTLKQGKKYFVGLQFKAKGLPITNLFEGDFLVVKPLKIVKTSPKQKVQNASKKSELKLTFNKVLKPLFLGSYIKIKPSHDVKFDLEKGKVVKITAKKAFSTDTDYKITIDKAIEATDSAVLEKDFILKFKTAGPVTVVGTSPSGWGIPLVSIVSMTFDQKVNRQSAEAGFSIQPKVAGAFSWSGNTMTFIPSNTLNLFKQYSFSLASGIKSPGGEPSRKVFSYNFKTTSERQLRIGTSVKGRSITAYYFGTGSKKVLLAGSMHGSESNTGELLVNWVSYLRANQNQIPSDRTFIVVPYSNPDGVASENRLNAHKVDLNRNWGTSSWQKKTYWNNTTLTSGGGSAPFSEPETRALRNLINKENPKITISYHAAAGMVISDSISSSLRDWYSKKTGYTVIAGAADPYKDYFSYNVTGSMEEWLGERGKIVLVVELASPYSTEYLRNLPALKGLLTYKL